MKEIKPLVQPCGYSWLRTAADLVTLARPCKRASRALQVSEADGAQGGGGAQGEPMGAVSPLRGAKLKGAGYRPGWGSCSTEGKPSGARAGRGSLPPPLPRQDSGVPTPAGPGQGGRLARRAQDTQAPC